MIPPPTRVKENGLQPHPGEENGSRTYQFIFTKLQILPTANYNVAPVADETHAQPPPTKKRIHVDGELSEKKKLAKQDPLVNAQNNRSSTKTRSKESDASRMDVG